MKSAWQGESGDDIRLVAALSILLAALTSLPVLAALVAANSSGLEWTGRVQLSPEDLAVYLSSIAQALRGKVLFENLASTERFVPMPNAVWSLAGLLGSLAGLSPLASYQALRVLLIPVFVSVSWGALTHFVLPRRPRVLAVLLLLFGSGLGAIVAPFLTATPPANGDYAWPTDLWVGESNAFLSAMFSPHFLASWTLLIGAFWMLSKAYVTGRRTFAVLAGTLALLLFHFHPFYAPTLVAVGLVWLVLAAFRDGRERISNLIACYAAFAVMSIPAVAYHYWLITFTANGAFMRDSNLLWTPSPAFVLIGLGGFALLAPFGRAEAARIGGATGRRADELAAWAAVTFVLVYMPVSFQRRLLEGIEFPLAGLAGFAIAAFRERRASSRLLAVVADEVFLAFAFLPSSLYALLALSSAFSRPEAGTFFFAKSESAALAWTRSATATDAVFLATVGTGNKILGWGERRVYAGHWNATANLAAREAEIGAFFGTMTPGARASFLSANGVGYVYSGPDEQRYGSSLDADPGLERAFVMGDVVIYKVRP